MTKLAFAGNKKKDFGKKYTAGGIKQRRKRVSLLSFFGRDIVIQLLYLGFEPPYFSFFCMGCFSKSHTFPFFL